MSAAHVTRRSVLFVDESNTRLSFMAEHVARARLGDHAVVSSAGYDVREGAPSERAVASLAARGIRVESHVPRPLRTVQVAAFDLIVALSRTAADKIPRAARDHVVIWSVTDPWQGSDEAYADVIAALGHAIDGLARRSERAARPDRSIVAA